MVEVKGERFLAASCIRKPSSGMDVTTNSPRAVSARRLVFELLLADQPAREKAFDPDSRFWKWAEKVCPSESRFPSRERTGPDRSHPAMERVKESFA